MISNVSLLHKQYMHRLETLAKYLDRIALMMDSHCAVRLIPFKYLFTDSTNLAEHFGAIQICEYPCDGLLIKTNDPYKVQTVLKWKPEHYLSIDFFVHSVKDEFVLYTYC